MKKYKYIARLAGTISMLLMMYLLFLKLPNNKDAWIIYHIYNSYGSGKLSKKSLNIIKTT